MHKGAYREMWAGIVVLTIYLWALLGFLTSLLWLLKHGFYTISVLYVLLVVLFALAYDK